MQVDGFELRDKDGKVVERWKEIPARIDLPNNDVVFCATASWTHKGYTIAPVIWTEPDVPIIKKSIPKSVIIERLNTTGFLSKFVKEIEKDIYMRERWYAADLPSVFSDDSAIVLVLQSIGAKAEEVFL